MLCIIVPKSIERAPRCKSYRSVRVKNKLIFFTCGKMPHLPYEFPFSIFIFGSIGNVDHFPGVVSTVIHFVKIKAVIDIFEITREY